MRQRGQFEAFVADATDALHRAGYFMTGEPAFTTSRLVGRSVLSRAPRRLHVPGEHVACSKGERPDCRRVGTQRGPGRKRSR